MRALLVGLSFLGCAVLASETPAPAVIVAKAKLEHLEDRLEALGTLRANESVAVTASVTETLTAIHFDDGDRVAAGDILVEMTSTEERALLEEATATLEEARRQYDRVKSLAARAPLPVPC